MASRFRGDCLGFPGPVDHGMIYTDGGAKFTVRRSGSAGEVWELDGPPEDLGDAMLRDLYKLAEINDEIPSASSGEEFKNWSNNTAIVLLWISNLIGKGKGLYPSVIVRVFEDGRSAVEVNLTRMADEDRLDDDAIRTMMELLARSGMTLMDVITKEDEGYGRFWELRIGVIVLDLPIIDIWKFAQQTDVRLKFPPVAERDRWLVTQILRSGRPEILIGLAENEWFEAKSRLHDIDTANGRIELAKDVAQFANAPQGGILAIGFHTKRVGPLDKVDKLAPLALQSNTVSRFHQILDSMIYPRISGLSIEVIGSASDKHLMVEVPQQSDSVKPFIVEGGGIDGKTVESVFMIPQRRHDGIRQTRGREIHALLAGRIFISTPETRGTRPAP